MSETATLLVMSACQSKFSSEEEAEIPTSELRDLAPEELSNLNGRAGLNVGDLYSGTLYNGNSNIKIRYLEIVVVTTIDGERVSRTYSEEVFIDPFTTGSFQFQIITGDNGADYNWSIAGAKGKPLD